MRHVAKILLAVGLWCAPAQAQIPDAKFEPIPDLPGWTLSARTGGSDQCSARIEGKSVDVMLAINRAGALIVMAGRPDWSFPGMEVKFQLQIDDNAPVPMDGSAIISLIVSQPEKSIADRIMMADRLAWLLPDGTHEAKVTGLAKAVEAIKVCEAGS